MRHIRRQKRIAAPVVAALLGAFSLAAGNAPAATGDFTAEIASTPTITVQGIAHKTIRFNIAYRNAGSVAIAGKLRVKAFLLPSHAYAPTDVANAGRVIGYMDSTVSADAGATGVIHFESALPPLRKDKYLLGVVINSDSAIAEENEKNNVTPLVDVGELEVYGARALNFDLYTEICGAFRLYYGGVSHTLRTIARGDNTFFPSSQYPSQSLWARFFAADLSGKRIYTLPYDTSTLDKQWYAISYNSERDAAGNPIYVDYYSQGPAIDDVPPGKYQFLTLINSKDYLPENFFGNNLDAKPFEITAVRTDGGLPVWIVADVGSATPAKTTLSIGKPYRKDYSWTAKIADGVNWLTVTPTSGAFTGNDNVEVTFTADVSKLAPGAYNTTVRFIASGYESYPWDVPVRLYVLDKVRPEISVNQTEIAFEATQGGGPVDKTLKITNIGDGKLDWSLAGVPEWLAVDAREGSLTAGQSKDLHLSTRTRGLAPYGSFSARLDIRSSARSTPVSLPLGLRLTVQ